MPATLFAEGRNAAQDAEFPEAAAGEWRRQSTRGGAGEPRGQAVPGPAGRPRPGTALGHGCTGEPAPPVPPGQQGCGPGVRPRTGPAGAASGRLQAVGGRTGLGRWGGEVQREGHQPLAF